LTGSDLKATARNRGACAMEGYSDRHNLKFLLWIMSERAISYEASGGVGNDEEGIV
jgi:hypothetical protein